MESVAGAQDETGIREGLAANNDHICVRFLRKKFQCLIVFILFFVSCIEFLRICVSTLNNTNVDTLNKFVSVLLSQKDFNITNILQNPDHVKIE